MPDLSRTLLEQAAARLGVSPLAKRLNVRDGVLAAWITGHAPIPNPKLAELADLLYKLGDKSER
jgi:succinate dehydrogenase flavin-adding protein (antitoxin of CptAB toxin-antitoxin module)